MTLSDAPVGTRLRIQALRAHADLSRRLRELGLCENAEVHLLLKAHGNILCEIASTRIGLDRRLGRTILVTAAE